MRVIIYLLGTLVVVWLVARLWPVERVNPPAIWVGSDEPLVIAHQGGNREAPGNTLVAFDRAVAAGADALELDVALTADDQLAVIHDLTVERTTDGAGAVSELTMAQLASLDAGYGLEDEQGRVLRDPAHNPFVGSGVAIPALRELFDRHRSIPMLIELKNEGERGQAAAGVLADLIDEFDRTDRTIVASFHEETIQAFRQASDGRVATSASQDEMIPFYVAFRLGLRALNTNLPFQAMQLPTTFDIGPVTIDLTTEAFRAYADSRGLPIHYWTINDIDTMRRLADLGAAGLITDRPAVMRGLFDRP